MVASQNGYVVIDKIDYCKNFSLGNSGVVLPLRRGAVGYVLAHFGGRFHNIVENLNKDECFGYNKRQISGSSDWSNHASGTAIDLNSRKHYYGARDTFDYRQLSKLRSLMEDYDGILRWGGDYRYTKDEMHFEIDAGTKEVAMVARRMRRNNTVSLRRLKPGKRNIDVYMVKRRLKEEGFFDGQMNLYFSVGFRKSYAEWQRSLGYTGSGADGVPGRASLEALGLKVTE